MFYEREQFRLLFYSFQNWGVIRLHDSLCDLQESCIIFEWVQMLILIYQSPGSAVLKQVHRQNMKSP